MSITKRGTSYQVNWRDDQSRQRSQTFSRKADADAFEAKVKLAKRRGDLEDLDKGRTTFAVMMDKWWETDAKHRLATKTLDSYKVLRDRYLIPAFGTTQLRKIKPEKVQRFKADLTEKGVEDATIRKALVLLQGVMGMAELYGYVQSNPVRAVKKPKQARNSEPVTLAPAAVELLRSKLLEIGLLPDATLVSLLAYSGMRPGEALALTWGDIGAKSIRVTKASSNGVIKETKTGQTRTVLLLAPPGGRPRQVARTVRQPEHASLCEAHGNTLERSRLEELAASAFRSRGEEGRARGHAPV